jgi:hypothetical protein
MCQCAIDERQIQIAELKSQGPLSRAAAAKTQCGCPMSYQRRQPTAGPVRARRSSGEKTQYFQ